MGFFFCTFDRLCHCLLTSLSLISKLPPYLCFSACSLSLSLAAFKIFLFHWFWASKLQYVIGWFSSSFLFPDFMELLGSISSWFSSNLESVWQLLQLHVYYATWCYLLHFCFLLCVLLWLVSDAISLCSLTFSFIKSNLFEHIQFIFYFRCYVFHLKKRHFCLFISSMYLLNFLNI